MSDIGRMCRIERIHPHGYITGGCMGVVVDESTSSEGNKILHVVFGVLGACSHDHESPTIITYLASYCTLGERLNYPWVLEMLDQHELAKW